MQDQKTLEFIKKARKIHGDKYDYSKVIYKDCKTEIVITCRIHKDFIKTPISHINELSGCRMCLKDKRLKIQKSKYVSFIAARNFAKKLKLKSINEWNHFCQKGKKPINIPQTAHIIYKSEWKGYGDFLGTGNLQPKNVFIIDYVKAVKILKKFKIKNQRDYGDKYHLLKLKKYGIPRIPEKTYKKRNTWFGWGKFLTSSEVKTRKIKKYFPPNYWTLQKCKSISKEYNTKKQWRRYDIRSYHSAEKHGWLKICSSHMIENRKPNNYWTKERCRQEALKYDRQVDFYNFSSSAAGKAQKNGWMDSFCKHMKFRDMPKKWTKEKCIATAKQFKSKSKLEKKYSGVMYVIRKNNWQKECFNHMVELIKPHSYWTKKLCKQEALKCKSRTEFKERPKSAYAAALKNNWLEAICSHMIPCMHKPFTFKECKEKALKCKNKREFFKLFKNHYIAASRKGWMEEICKHMVPLGNRYNKVVYAYEFSDKSVYVGLTYNERERKNAHLNPSIKKQKSSVYAHIKQTGLIPKYKIISKLIPVLDAVKLECDTIKKYQKNKWNVLNRIKGGSTGGKIRTWTKEKCKQEALKHKTKTQLRLKSNGAYDSMRKNGWMKDFCEHMTGNVHNGFFSSIKKPNGYWTLKKCKLEAKKFKSKTEWSNNSGSSYCIACKNNWLELCCKHIKNKNRVHTLESCQKIALNYNRKIDWVKGDLKSYGAAQRHNWIDKCSNHMTKQILQLSKNGKILNKFPSVREAERKLKISHGNISMALTGKRNIAGGFKWKYAA